MADTISGKVAAIVDDTTLVLNVGRQHGVREGQMFAVVAAHQEIHDPDTGQSLGQWESVKARVVITHVQDRMSTARSPVAEAGTPTGTLSAMMVRHSFGLYGQRERDGERESLSVRSGSAHGRPRSQPIEVGDTARSISLEGLAEAARAEAPGGADNPTAPDLPSQSYQATPSAPAPAADADADA